jgi:hypothetical protein
VASQRFRQQLERFLFPINADESLLLEAKHIELDNWPDMRMKGALPELLVSDSRPDTIFNRFSNRIHEAVKKFNTVNPDHG